MDENKTENLEHELTSEAIEEGCIEVEKGRDGVKIRGKWWGLAAVVAAVVVGVIAIIIVTAKSGILKDIFK